MRKQEFRPGFRLSILDLAVLALGLSGAILLGTMNWQAGLVIGLVVCHFFLFCNVLRASRPLELAWSGIFIILAAGTITWGFPGWPIAVAASLGAAALVAFLEMRRASYHGVGWRRINPELLDWWQSHTGDLNED